MSKKIRPTSIGAFVVGAVALLVMAVIALGSGELFRQTKEFVLFFDGSVNGLHTAAPVKLKGVEIGSVKNILLQMEKGTPINRIPVIIEIDLKKLVRRGVADAPKMDTEAVDELINQGLRGQLQTESLLTGVLYVALDFFPGTPVNLVQKPGGHYKLQEIPTVPSELEQAHDAISRIVNKLDDIDFKGLINSVSQTLNGVNQLVTSPALKSAVQSLDKTIPKIAEAAVGLHELTTDVDRNMTSLTANLEQTSDAARAALQQTEIMMKQTDAALKEAEAAITNLRGISDPDSPTFYELNKSLREVSAAARSLRLLSNYLERNPTALIFGKPESQDRK
jgi:paraquat-inducible protein B